MSIISVSNLSKSYRLGTIGGGTIREDFARWWAKVRGRPDPMRKVGQEADTRKHGQKFWALQDVSFEVQRGEILGIIGRNGAGKSTLLKILSRVTAPTSGEVRVKGRIASLLEVGTGFHPELTGSENIFLNGAILGMSKTEIRKKFEEIVAFSGVAEFIDTPVKRYSSGMYVRLAFAVAAHLEPEILIIDEVLAVGDVDFQKKCLGKMSEVATGGRTVLFVSHNMLAVQKLCSRCMSLDSGALRASGHVSEVVDDFLATGATDVFSTSHEGNSPKIVSAKVLTSAVRIDAPLEILVEWFLPKSIPGIKIGVGFNTYELQRIFDSAPEDLGITSPDSPGYHKAVFRVPPHVLMARSYLISIGLWKESVVFDHLLPALSVTVEAAANGPYAHQSSRDGMVQVATQWLELQ